MESRRKNLWQPPRGLSAVQRFPHHNIFILTQCSDDMDFFLYKREFTVHFVEYKMGFSAQRISCESIIVS